jgi:hypothetical protein
MMGITAAYADPPVDKPVTKKDPALDALVSSDALRSTARVVW